MIVYSLNMNIRYSSAERAPPTDPISFVARTLRMVGLAHSTKTLLAEGGVNPVSVHLFGQE